MTGSALILAQNFLHVQLMSKFAKMSRLLWEFTSTPTTLADSNMLLTTQACIHDFETIGTSPAFYEEISIRQL